MQQNTRTFIEVVEKYVAEFMLSKRAVFWICDSVQSELYRIALNSDGRDWMTL